VRTVAAVLVLAAGLAAAWWSFWTSPVVLPGEGSFGVTVHSSLAEKPYTAGSFSLCLDGVETATIDDVTVDSGGLIVTAFAARPQPKPPALGLGYTQQTLESTGFGTNRTITGQCEDGPGSEIGVEVIKATPATARTDGLFVHWSSGLRSGTVRVPLEYVLCDPGDTADPDCQDVP
jgi:hypothetical protein